MTRDNRLIHTRLLIAVLSIHLLSCAAGPRLQPTEEKSPLVATYEDAANRFISAALADSFAYGRLAYLTDTFGSRFSGTQNLEDAIDWVLEEMERDGLENVHGEDVMVPRWIRGTERAELLEPRQKKLEMLGLGGSVGTPPEGITAEVLVVGTFDELAARAEEAAGKIVLFNAPFTSYGETVKYRYGGASAAAKAGAVASLVRSVGPFSMNTPHTGGMRYEEDVPEIPHAAITVEDAMMLQRMVDRGQRVVVRLYMEAHVEADAPSRNVVAQITGGEKPHEVVVLGGHIDSWDVGTGAMDDAGGCVAAWEAVRLMQKLGLRPRRTVRVVLWTNEENGLRGGKAYRDAHRDELDRHILAMESDNGVFKPVGFGFTGSEEARGVVEQIARLLEP
ncbi:MAG: M20/M25/M40 family metallo-hydrolase, partial [Fidelibacterota bacterium]